MIHDDLKSINLLSFNPINIVQLKAFNQRTFPVNYLKSFYSDVIDKHVNLCVGLTYKDYLIGTICCRIQKKSVLLLKGHHVYIMLLGIDPQFRQKGLASYLLEYIYDKIEMEYTHISYIYLHVQVNNTCALNFYQKHGFLVYKTVYNYYKVDPTDAYILYKQVNTQE